MQSRTQPDSDGRVWALAIAGLAIFVSSASASMVTLALPDMLRAMRNSAGDLTWISIAYLVPYAAVLPVAGKLADLRGHRPVLLWSFAIFALGSALGLSATHVWSVLAVRALAGVGGGGLTISMAWVASAWKGPRQGSALGVWRALLLAGTVGGPALGGILTASLGWQSVLWTPAPFALVGFALTIVLLKGERRGEGREERPAEPGSFDGYGALVLVMTLVAFLVVLGLSGLVMGPTAVRAAGPTSAAGSGERVLWLLYGLVAAGWLLLWRRLANARHPILDLDVIASRRSAFANLGTFLICVGMFSAMFFLPLELVEQQHMSVLEAALMTLPMAGSALLVGVSGGFLTDRLGVVRPTAFGFALLALSFVLLAFLRSTTPGWYALGALTLAGVGMGLPLAPTAVTAMESAPEDRAGEAAGVFNLSHNLGRPVGLAVLGVGLVPSLALSFSHVFLLSAAASLLGVFGSFGMARRPHADTHREPVRAA